MSEADFIAFPPASEAGSSTPKKTGGRAFKERINTTLFVSSLPYTATSTDLVTHFSYLGPVRHGFVATDKASGKSKGVGYVTYSLKEDAEQALLELDNKDFGGNGRKIRVGWATARPGTLERIKKAEIAAEEPGKVYQPGLRVKSIDTSSASTSAAGAAGVKVEEGEEGKDPKAIRTVVVSGLPEVTKAVLWKKVRKVNEGIEVLFPVEGQEGVAHLVFPSHGEAVKGIGKLHGHTYKEKIVSAVLKKRVEKLGMGQAAGKGVSHAGRLIVRNLAWHTTEQDLRATFLPYGPINSIDLPKAPSNFPERNGKDAKPRARGFAFVWFVAKTDAEKAIEGVNGKPIKYASEAARANAKKEEARVVAVDWALSKDKWEEIKKDGEGVKKEEAEEEGSSDEEENGEEGEDEDVEMKEGAEEQEEDEDVKPVKPTLPTVDVGSTLFIRNLPFEVTEQELNTLFRSFGPLRYARITMDKTTGRSRGSGFVCFWKTEDADAAIEEAERVNQETGTNSTPLGGGNNPFALPSVLTVDPSSSLASRLVINGRSLEVTRAVTREQAGQMKEDGERARATGDKRNTYLMREGVVFPNSPAAASLPAAELEKRQEAFNARRTLLRSNPSLYISKTRLSIRQLPLFVTDRTLKRLAIHAIRTFDAEVEAETREPLTRIEEFDDTLSPAIAARGDKGKNKKKAERETPVIQSKVVRQTEKVDPLTNMGRSKGYGFLEIRSHREALKVLRWANNNAEIGELVWGWWKEEMKEVLERAKKELESRRKPVEAAEEGEEGKKAEGKEKEKESIEELEARVRKLEERSREGDDRSSGGMRGGKTLMIEFSIENVQVVKRRVEKITTARSDSRSDPRPAKRAAVDSDDEGAAPAPAVTRAAGPGGRDRSKRQRTDGPAPSTTTPAADGAARRVEKREKANASGKKPQWKPPVQRSNKAPGEKTARGRERTEKRDKERAAKAAAAGAGGGAGGTGGAPAEASGEKRGIEKQGANLGSMIGRKRRMRKGGK